MLLIDKSKPVTKFYFTASEQTSQVNNLKLEIHSDFTNKTLEYILGDDISPFPARINHYQAWTSSFSTLQPGRYMYKVKMIDSDELVEQGTLLVIPDNKTPEQQLQDKYITLPSANSDGYVVL